MILERIQKENDIKELSDEELKILASEIRQFLIEKISDTGGHLASNLGVIELTMALHLFLDLPKDKLIWDVGHQSYTHKLLTGRKEGFDQLRKYGGMSGFPKRKESECDCFDTGHSSTSISAGLGYAHAREITGENYKVVSVIGDGALTGGMAFEALNNAAQLNSNFIIVLNDNNMSISENVGGLSTYLAGFRTADAYRDLKLGVMNSLNKIPVYGDKMVERIRRTKSGIKQLFIPGMLFEELGIIYLGPVDGGDIKGILKLLQEASRVDGPVLVHVITHKGTGYAPAERHPARFHGTEPFDIETGLPKHPRTKANYTDVFSTVMRKLGDRDERVVAITAAMTDGTGLKRFHNMFPERFFDVGIAEQHAVTFAAGLAAGGLKPIFAVYSSFLQRAYDQILHDVCIQNLPVVFAIDRAGLVGSDGETHQGLFDVAMLSSVPGITLYSPATYEEMRCSLYKSLYEHTGVCCVRYPRGGESKLPAFDPQVPWAIEPKGAKPRLLLVTYGKLSAQAVQAAQTLSQQGVPTAVLKLLRLLPFCEEAVEQAMQAEYVLFAEEGIESGGIGQMFGSRLLENGFQGHYRVLAVHDRFVEQATPDRALALCGLDAQSMVQTCTQWMKEQQTEDFDR